MDEQWAMTAAELERELRKSWSSADLLRFLDVSRSRFLDLPGEVFVELVLTDASKLQAFEESVARIKEQIASERMRIDAIIRGLWTVRSVEYVGPARGASGGLRAALAFRATLESGQRSCHVAIEVSFGAEEILRKRLSEKISSNEKVLDVLTSLVEQLLILQLSKGGTSYWDPIHYPHQELNEAAIMFLLARTS